MISAATSIAYRLAFAVRPGRFTPVRPPGSIRTPRACPFAARLVPALLALAAGLGSPTASFAQDIDFPALTGRVVDAARLLDPATEAALDARLAAHESASSDQVVVATVPSLDGRDIADYAVRLGRAWGIGTAENDNGVLLVVAPNEREVRIEVGYGLEGALTDALASSIVRREILPAFRSGDYARGIDVGVDAILRAIDGEYVAPPAGTSGDGDAHDVIAGILPLVFVAMVALPQLLRRLGARRLAHGAFPAGFAGLMASLFSNSLIVGIVVALAVFAIVWSNGGGGSGDGRSGRVRRRRSGVIVGGGGFGGGLGGGGFGGGGFGGGGGSFGGGGASGSW